MSLSARRAWIEIMSTLARSAPYWSLSARRAWIEINTEATNHDQVTVALRKESVDRNHAMQIVIIVMDSRSPQGERG